MNIQTPAALKSAFVGDIQANNVRDYRTGSFQQQCVTKAENAIAQYADAVKPNKEQQVMFLLKVARDIAAPHSNVRDMLNALLDMNANGSDGEGDAMDERGDRFMTAARDIAEDYGASTTHWG